MIGAGRRQKQDSELPASIIHGMDGAAIERRLREFFEARAEAEGIAAAWLFGRFARNISKSESSIEIGVLFKEEPFVTLGEDGDAFSFPPIRGRGWAGEARVREKELGDVGRVRRDLEGLLERTVHIVVLNDCEWLELMFEMLRDDQLLVENDKSQRVEFEVRTLNEFWDFEPNLRLMQSKNAK